MVLADDRVGLPITEPRFVCHYRRALINALAIRQLAAPVVFTITFAALLLAAQGLMKIAALALVGIDVLIDALVAGSLLSLRFESATDLFGRPILTQTGFDLLPGVGADAGGLFFRLAAGVGQLLGLFRAVAAPAAIAFEFAADGGFIDAQLTSDVRLGEVGF